MNYWFTGDTHWYHKNIIKHAKRPFALDDISSMNEALIEAWNIVVNPGDVVYHVGDFAWTDSVDLVEELIKQLNGQIHIVYGNHDRKGVRKATGFASARDYKEIKIPIGNDEKQVICLFHYSCRVWNKSHHGSWHLYGHSHDSLAPNLATKSFDVGVDAIARRFAIKAGRETLDYHDFRPINFDEVAEIMKEHRWWKPIDHHKEKSDEKV